MHMKHVKWYRQNEGIDGDGFFLTGPDGTQAEWELLTEFVKKDCFIIVTNEETIDRDESIYEGFVTPSVLEWMVSEGITV